MNKVIDKGFRSCRFVSTIVKHPVYFKTKTVVAHAAKCWTWQRNVFHLWIHYWLVDRELSRNFV